MILSLISSLMIGIYCSSKDRTSFINFDIPEFANLKCFWKNLGGFSVSNTTLNYLHTNSVMKRLRLTGLLPKLILLININNLLDERKTLCAISPRRGERHGSCAPHQGISQADSCGFVRHLPGLSLLLSRGGWPWHRMHSSASFTRLMMR